MYAYIDESGNSGKNLKDPHQPYFYHMALVSNDNLDENINFKPILDRYNISEIHASAQSDLIESYAKDFLSILSKHDIHFFFRCTEKRTFAYIKLFEAIFDSGENKYADPGIYNNEPLKLALLHYFMKNVENSIAFEFFEKCLMAENQNDAIEKFNVICAEILKSLQKGRNDKINFYISRAIFGAKNFPQNLSIFSDTKNYDIPNLFDWMAIIRDIYFYSKGKNIAIDKVVHDSQEQLKKDMSVVFSMSTKLYPIPQDSLEIKSSARSFGLQSVDVCLYILTHMNKFSNCKNTRELFHFIKNRCSEFYTNQNVLPYANGTNSLTDYIVKHLYR